ncbi:hypothetical protein H0H87_009036 [Tephrocybe sp. NHM501043]|nr:hypothetical protein H0H87_009036 [Tephrocybe sp. NHM501043]
MYKRKEFQLRVGIFYASASLSGAFGGLLATAITKMDGVGGLAGWRWIFVMPDSDASLLLCLTSHSQILEGLATILASLVAAYILPADIESARFLTEEERAFASKRLRGGDVTMSTGTPGQQGVHTPSIMTEKAEDPVVIDPSLPDTVHSSKDNTERFEWREVTRGLLNTILNSSMFTLTHITQV